MMESLIILIQYYSPLILNIIHISHSYRLYSQDNSRNVTSKIMILGIYFELTKFKAP